MRALVIGLGQNGRLMCERLISEGIPFRSVIRRSSSSVGYARQSGIPSAQLISQSVFSAEVLVEIYSNFPFTHIFNFAANSFVQDSGDHFKSYIESNSGITWELLKFLKKMPDIWMLQPLSCEILIGSPTSEDDLPLYFAPRNAYGLSKLVDLHSCSIERQNSGSQIFSPILFNHESRLRPEQFFSRKVLKFLKDTSKSSSELQIFNTASVRDWGSAPEYIGMLLSAAPDRLIGQPLLGTGHGMTIETFIDHAITALSLKAEKRTEDGLLRWFGEGWQITEANRDPRDEARIVVANRTMVATAFGRAPKIFGAELVRQLAQDVI